MDANCLNTVGLALDIAGAVLLFKYGLPSDINATGHIGIATQKVDHEGIRLGKIYKRNSRIALGLLIVGFFIQAVSNYV